MKTYEIKYIDKWTNGEWRKTSYSCEDYVTLKDIVYKLGLERDKNVYAWDVTSVRHW